MDNYDSTDNFSRADPPGPEPLLITDLITQLEGIKEQFGDLPVYLETTGVLAGCVTSHGAESDGTPPDQSKAKAVHLI